MPSRPRGEQAMLIKDKTGGNLLQAELESPLDGNGPPLLVADNGQRTIELDAKSATMYYKLISATKGEVDQLLKAGFKMVTSDEFKARDD
jgi:hypothetical protein